MESFYYNNPVKVFFGTDSVHELAKVLKKFHKKNLMLVYGEKSIKSNGVYDEIVNTLQGFNLIDFGGIADPEYKYVLSGIEIAKNNNVEVVIGIGGCTCMDIAKIIAFGVLHDDLEDYLRLEKSPKNGDALPLVMIPTYPSGGSEINSASEVDNLPNGVHGSLYGIYADYACLNPEFTYSLNEKNTAFAALVTFMQASVNFLGGSSEIAESFTKEILRIILDSLNKCLKNPKDFTARGNQMWASAMTTMGLLSLGKDNSWAMSVYEEVEHFRRLMGLSYRKTFTIFFPRWLLSRAKYHEEDVYKYVHEVLGIEDKKTKKDTIKAGYNKLIKMLEEYGVPAYFDEYENIPSDEAIQADIDEFPSDELTDEDVFKMLKDCLK